MAKKDFEKVLKSKHVPVLTIDNKWHRLFGGDDVSAEMKSEEAKINELLKRQGKINLITPAEVTGLIGEETLTAIEIEKDGEKSIIETDYLIPLFGLTPKLGPLAEWGLEIEKNAIKVNNALDYQTNIDGIYAIGDVNTYPGKLKLILCGFHEATLMCQSVYNRLNPGKKFVLKYTTVSGVDGFDGTRKEAEKAVVKSID